MATLVTQSIVRSGLERSYVAAAGGGDKFTPGPDLMLEFINASGGDITVTVATQKTDGYGHAIADDTIVVTAGESRLAGPFPGEVYAAAADGLGTIAYSGVTTFTVAALTLSRP